MHDLIDRKAAIDILDAYQVMVENGEENPYSWARFRMSELPSAQQDCTECPEYDHTTHACPKFCDVIRKTVEEAKQERTGRWIHETDSGAGMLKCSVCECRVVEREYKIAVGTSGLRFCPYCGSFNGGE